MDSILAPYLHFNGNAADAMDFYKSVFGGELTLQTFGDAHMGKNPEENSRIMHATLTSDHLSFMASDSRPEQAVEFGSNVDLSLMSKDHETLTKYFNDLAVGGQVTMPLAQQFWGDTFGMVTDKFGIHWMVNIAKS